MDYSLKAYVEVMFLNPQMKITVQGSPVNTHMPYILLCCDILYSCCLCFFLFPMLALVPYDATPTSTFRRGGTRTQLGYLIRFSWPIFLSGTPIHPVTNSIIMEPKLYMSDLSEVLAWFSYSGARYPLQENMIA